ncbi:mitochondrial fission ELM1 family protein [Roseomonas sp. GC11]|uniref:mitochondrial fission ELM1 family protein n=1 Tax=Roseomonas sp. GC11 TaxID=2950546 RepID=UPI0021096441|nr:mitochondrial fission ELM1 family protein [Roseomonas sp. GC11]MCQ4161135.1 mitochondrial fission ELM1 family protein [Roseomonas sp. GC11]
MTDASPGVWVLADPRAGTAAQALGIAERLGVPFRSLPLEWGALARIPWPVPTLAGLAPGARAALLGPAPGLVISAGRRSAPVARWLGRRGARLVHAMRPGFGAESFDLLVIGRHDAPKPAANLFPILGACHRMGPAVLATARAEWAELAALPGPRVALLLGGAVRGQGMEPALAAALGRQAAGLGGSVLATTSRRSGAAARQALAAALEGVPHRLHGWGGGGANPYAGFLAWADAIIVTGDSVSMLSEALASPAPVFIAETTTAPRHRRLWESLYAAGQARPLAPGAALFPRAPLDEAARVAAEIQARGWMEEVAI